jgi:pimeloyl-ACP methyl ester carboxylesterase
MGDTALTWDKLMIGGGGAPAAPRGTRLLALELPGTEGSAPAADYGVRAQAAAVRRALEARCPRWTVAGNSLGGWISAWVALDWPEGVERLVLFNPAGVTDPTGRALETGRTLAEPTVAALREFEGRARHAPRPAPDRVLARVAEMIRSRPVKETYAAFREADALDAHLPRLRVPLEVVWGESDRLIPVETARRFAALARGARLTLVPACGHLPQQECPAAASAALFPPAR